MNQHKDIDYVGIGNCLFWELNNFIDFYRLAESTKFSATRRIQPKIMHLNMEMLTENVPVA